MKYSLWSSILLFVAIASLGAFLLIPLFSSAQDMTPTDNDSSATTTDSLVQKTKQSIQDILPVLISKVEPLYQQVESLRTAWKDDIERIRSDYQEKISAESTPDETSEPSNVAPQPALDQLIIAALGIVIFILGAKFVFYGGLVLVGTLLIRGILRIIFSRRR